MIPREMAREVFGRDSLKRAVVPWLALLASAVFGGLSFVSPWWLIGLAASLSIVVLGIYDAFQTRFTLTRNYPVAARIRWLFHDLRPYLRSYIVEGDLEGKPYSIEARNLVYARARG